LSRLHLFNPENDLALAQGLPRYTPPSHAAALHRAGALMPAWWAGEDDRIVAPPEMEADLAHVRDRFGLHGRIHTAADGALTPDPWGWSADAVRQFRAVGVDGASLPSDSRISELRYLSHRRTAAEILRLMGREDLAAVETSDPDEVLALEAAHTGCYVKSPWSCSGRGVFCASALSRDVLRTRVAGLIRRQGSVTVERGVRDKTLDFAALYRSEGGKVTFAGLSVFRAEERGTYGGNIVASQDWIRELIVSHVDSGELDRAISCHEKILTPLVGSRYTGWLGIDMMAGASSGLHPCIELNLRRTMGVVAMHVASRLDPSPSLMSWTLGTPDGITLLPPREGFALTLKRL